MDQPKRQDASIGNGPIKTRRPGSDGDPTEGLSIPSQKNTDIESLNTLNEPPKDPIEALGLLQSRYSDLISLDLIVILEGSPKGKLYAVISWPGHTLGAEDGHILADGIPVLSDTGRDSDTGKNAPVDTGGDTGKEEE